MTHGPRNEKNFARTVSKKMKAKALYTILSKKFKDNEIVFIDNLALSAPKTKEALGVFQNLGKIGSLKNISKKTNALYLALDKKDQDVERSFRNFNNVKVEEARNLNPLAAASYKHIVFVNPDVSLKAIVGKLE